MIHVAIHDLLKNSQVKKWWWRSTLQNDTTISSAGGYRVTYYGAVPSNLLALSTRGAQNHCSKGKYSGENKNPLKLYGNQTQQRSIVFGMRRPEWKGNHFYEKKLDIPNICKIVFWVGMFYLFSVAINQASKTSFVFCRYNKG